MSSSARRESDEKGKVFGVPLPHGHCLLYVVFCLFVFVFAIVCIFVSISGGLVMWALAWVKKQPRSFSSKVLKVAEWPELFQLSYYIIISSKNISREKTWISLISIHSSMTSIHQVTLVK